MNKRDQKDLGKLLYSGSAGGFYSRRPGGGRGYNWEAEDSDDDHSHYVPPDGKDGGRGGHSFGDLSQNNNYYMGRD